MLVMLPAFSCRDQRSFSYQPTWYSLRKTRREAQLALVSASIPPPSFVLCPELFPLRAILFRFLPRCSLVFLLCGGYLSGCFRRSRLSSGAPLDSLRVLLVEFIYRMYLERRGGGLTRNVLGLCCRRLLLIHGWLTLWQSYGPIH